jgi:hypothetical protein
MRAFALCVAVAFACAAALACGGDAGAPDVLDAVIVDQLAQTDANPGFVASVTATLEGAGYRVDYVAPHDVTVDYYRELPGRGYDLVVVRAHSGIVQNGEGEGDSFLFTTERYSQGQHVDEQRDRRLVEAVLSTDLTEPSVPLADLPRYFGIGPEFVRSSMNGRFGGALVVVMGCNGLSSNTLAEALVERGAAEVTSWDGLVSAAHTDAATEQLLGLVFAEGMPVEEAVAAVREDLGPDPFYGSSLLAYVP